MHKWRNFLLQNEFGDVEGFTFSRKSEFLLFQFDLNKKIFLFSSTFLFHLLKNKSLYLRTDLNLHTKPAIFSLCLQVRMIYIY